MTLIPALWVLGHVVDEDKQAYSDSWEEQQRSYPS